MVNVQVVDQSEKAREEREREGGAEPPHGVVREEHRDGRVVEGAVPGGPLGVRVVVVGGVQDDGR